MNATPNGGLAPVGTLMLGSPHALAGTLHRSVACRHASRPSMLTSRG